MVGVPATFEIVNSTIAGNSASGRRRVRVGHQHGHDQSRHDRRQHGRRRGTRDLDASGAAVAVERSLLTGNGPAACAGDVTSGGGNVVDTTCFAAPAASDATRATAPVGALGPNGGPTDTVLPLAGSAAIDHVACTGADQRAVARPQGSACDAGAVETRPARLVASGPLALGGAVVGQHSAPASVTITNDGDFDATITGISLPGPNAAEVEPVADPDACSATTVLGAGETCVLKARLAPTSAGAKTATYSVAMGAALRRRADHRHRRFRAAAVRPGGGGSSNTGGAARRRRRPTPSWSAPARRPARAASSSCGSGARPSAPIAAPAR